MNTTHWNLNMSLLCSCYYPQEWIKQATKTLEVTKFTLLVMTNLWTESKPSKCKLFPQAHGRTSGVLEMSYSYLTCKMRAPGGENTPVVFPHLSRSQNTRGCGLHPERERVPTFLDLWVLRGVSTKEAAGKTLFLFFLFVMWHSFQNCFICLIFSWGWRERDVE